MKHLYTSPPTRLAQLQESTEKSLAELTQSLDAKTTELDERLTADVERVDQAALDAAVTQHEAAEDRERVVDGQLADLASRVTTLDADLTKQVDEFRAMRRLTLQLEQGESEKTRRLIAVEDDIRAKDLAYKAMFDELGIDPAAAEEICREMESEVAMSRQMSSMAEMRAVAPGDSLDAAAPMDHPEAAGGRTSVGGTVAGRTSARRSSTERSGDPAKDKQGARKRGGLTDP